jgi:Na+/proline symporter
LQAKLRKKNKEETAESYFLAGRSLVWWMVGGSLFASNIGGTQFIGVSGDAAATGIAVVSYEWQVWYTVVIRWSFCCVIYFMV